jgi:hypothetical protein
MIIESDLPGSNHEWKWDNRESVRVQSVAKGVQLMIHSAGRTWDCVAVGGLQLAQEMQQESSSPSTPSICISLPLVGNSLGGLYVLARRTIRFSS